MGGWYNKSLTELDVGDCPPSTMQFDRSIVMSLESLEECINAQPVDLTRAAYCTDAHETLQRGSARNDSELAAIFHFGDSDPSIALILWISVILLLKDVGFEKSHRMP